ncbi:MAG TPA: HAD family hydrolase [Candidatus Saccharimonadales bacterium]|nr:HAD family hydrolase [Candidatus Saccharimonadales bacterium]
MKKKIILFDIDYTLFNGRKYRANLWRRLAEKIAPMDIENFITQAEEIYLSLRETNVYFDPYLYADTLKKDTGISVEGSFVSQLTKELAKNGTALYDETVSVLEELEMDKTIDIGIFSTGLFELQKSKLAPIAHFFSDEHIHIFEDKKQNLSKVIERYTLDTIVLVDDYLELLEEAKKLNNAVHTIWIKRGRFAEKKTLENFIPDKIIRDLTEVVTYIKQI